MQLHKTVKEPPPPRAAGAPTSSSGRLVPPPPPAADECLTSIRRHRSTRPPPSLLQRRRALHCPHNYACSYCNPVGMTPTKTLASATYSSSATTAHASVEPGGGWSQLKIPPTTTYVTRVQQSCLLQLQPSEG